MTLTGQQNQEVERILKADKPDLQVVREFWQRKSVKGVGLSLKLNCENRPNEGSMREVRQEAVRNYTGIGSIKGKDGIFSSD